MPEPTPIRADAAMTWPEPPDDAAFYGLVGEIVKEVAPDTEADPIALLVTLLACAGNAMGTGPHYRVSGARHEARIFPVLVGLTSSGRKGTAVDTLAPILSAALPEWWGRHTKGMVSGEGLIYHVRDEVRTVEPVKSRGTIINYQNVISDVGVDDKRLLVIEKEFGGVLKVMTRENNTLSAVIREAWDGGILATLAKHAATRATGAHITILGHITPEELVELLSATDAHNGFANRFLWVCVRRSKLLPHGGDMDDGTILGIGEVLRAAIEDGARIGRLRLDDAARAAWEAVYEPLTTGEPGLVGALLSRGAPTVLRIATIHAALNGAGAIGLAHLNAGLALWQYADASVRQIFGVAPQVKATSAYRQTILAALAVNSLTMTEITNDLFGKNLRPPEPHATLDELLRAGLVDQSFERPAGGRGRSVTRWTLTDRGRGEVTG